MMLKQDGSVWTTGTNYVGQLGDQASQNRMAFKEVIAEGGVAIAAGVSHSIVLKEDGSLWATGRNYQGQLGDGTKVRKGTFVFVRMIPGANAVAAGSSRRSSSSRPRFESTHLHHCMQGRSILWCASDGASRPRSGWG